MAGIKLPVSNRLKASPDPEYQKLHSELVNRLQALEVSTNTIPGKNGSLSTKNDIDLFNLKLDLIQTKISDVEDANRTVFRHKKWNFGSQADIQAFAMKGNIPSCGIYWDLFSILVCMQEKPKTGKEKADNWKRVRPTTSG